MIQRIQSIYLVIALIFTGLMTLFSWVEYGVGEEVFAFNPSTNNEKIDSILLLPVIIIGLFVAIFALIQFKNRKFQMKLTRIGMLVSLLEFLAFGLFHYLNISKLKELGDVTIGYNPIVVLPLINIVLFWLAYKGIKKDDDLVKSVDRLR